ncbi:MAG: TrkA family potassium uptake protein [Anaerolineae bacterium]|nr:TrkA family potassium uptake protein [Anaerolineae bacterium]
MFVILVGGGKVGGYLGTLLTNARHRVILIENRQEHFAQLQREMPAEALVLGNGTDPALLERVGILEADVVAAVTGRDETNLVVSNLARQEFGVPRTIARVNNPKNAWMFTPEMGVDVAVHQAELLGKLILEEMSLGDMMILLKLQRGAYSLVEERVSARAPAVGRKISELGLPPECVLVAVMRAGDLIVARGNVTLAADDEVIALTHGDQVKALQSVLVAASSDGASGSRQ